MATLLFLGLLVKVATLNKAEDIVVGQNNSNANYSNEIPIESLTNLVCSRPGIISLTQQFKKVPTGQLKPCKISWNNTSKNRYGDIAAYDHTRVVLKEMENDTDDSSDYINANFIDGYNLKREYIATQGPLPATTFDFWRMVWQLNVRSIIMLANSGEISGNKCSKYWPDKDKAYGNLNISKVSEVTVGPHTVRTFNLYKESPPETRQARQFHYDGWPDHGVPSEALSLLALVNEAKKYNDLVPGSPLVIHCSAGIGRTGTLILMDSMYQMGKAEKNVDFMKKLWHMRNQRMNLVELEEQYIFAHIGVYEAFSPKGMAYLMNVIDQFKELNTNSIDGKEFCEAIPWDDKDMKKRKEEKCEEQEKGTKKVEEKEIKKEEEKERIILTPSSVFEPLLGVPKETKVSVSTL